MQISEDECESRLPLRYRLPRGVRELNSGDAMAYITSPGLLTELRCPVCGGLCRVERNRPGLPGVAAAMGGISHPHDRFTCPDDDQVWHCQAFDLIRELQKTASRRLAELIRLDLEETLAERLPAEKLRSIRRANRKVRALVSTGL
ncbi:MAG: hypothetical protein ACYC6L_08510 [Anaerolineae bacterium]